MIILRSHQKRNRRLVETPSLAIPLLDGIEGALAGEVEHEEDGDGVVADEREHVYEFALAAEVPDGEGDFGVADGDCFFHEVDAWGSCQLIVAY